MLRVFSRAGATAGMLAVALGATPCLAEEPNAHDRTDAGTASDATTARDAVTLTELLRHAARHAPEVRVARAGLARGRAEEEAAAPLFPADPVLMGAVGRRSTPGGSGVDYAVSLKQRIEISGARGARRRAASASLDSDRARLAAARWRVHQRVHAAYYRAVVERERAAAARSLLAFAKRVVRAARALFRAGETGPLPARLAEAELADARQASIAAARDYDTARSDLARAAGWRSERLPVPAGSLGTAKKAPSLRRLLALAKQHDPELRLLRARARAASAAHAAANRSRFPQPTVGVRYAREAEPATGAATIWQGTLSVPLPLWRANGPKRARTAAELHVVRSERGAYESTLRLRIRRARRAVDANARRVRVYGTEIVPKLEQSLKLVETSFSLGEIGWTDVLVARERFLRSERTALDAWEDYYRSVAELEAAVGTEVFPARAGGGR